MDLNQDRVIEGTNLQASLNNRIAVPGDRRNADSHEYHAMEQNRRSIECNRQAIENGVKQLRRKAKVLLDIGHPKTY